MTIQWIEGFDVYPNVYDTTNGLKAIWGLYGNGGEVSMVAGRFGGQAVSCIGFINTLTGYIQRNITPTTTFTIGFAVNLNTWNGGTPASSIAYVNNTGGILYGIGVDTNYHFYVYKGNPGDNNIVCTGSINAGVGAWHYVELSMDISATGFVHLYVDGTLDATFSGNTSSGAPASVGFGSFGAADRTLETNVYYDDMYFTDSSTNLGERRVQSLVPASDVSVQWTPSTGFTNYNLVNTLPVAGNPTQYVYANTASLQDLYGITSLSGTTTTIDCVQQRICVAKDNTAIKLVASALQSGANVTLGNTNTISSNYLLH